MFLLTFSLCYHGAIYWICQLCIQFLSLYWGLMWTSLLPRLLFLTPQWPLTVRLSWSVWLTVCCAHVQQIPASCWPCWIDDGLVPLTASHPSTAWYLLISQSLILSLVHLWWFVASRWEYHHWHHAIGPFLWEEREGRAYIWWLLQVL